MPVRLSVIGLPSPCSGPAPQQVLARASRRTLGPREERAVEIVGSALRTPGAVSLTTNDNKSPLKWKVSYSKWTFPDNFLHVLITTGKRLTHTCGRLSRSSLQIGSWVLIGERWAHREPPGIGRSLQAPIVAEHPRYH